MEGRNRIGGHSSGVVKNRSSSGCLIVKKKADGLSGVGSSKVSKLHESKKEKKRTRLKAAGSLSSDDEFIELYPKRGAPGRSQVIGDSLVYENNDFEDMNFGRNGMMRERSNLDVYDFDEYDDLSDVEMMRMRDYNDRGMGDGERRFMGAMPGTKNGSRLEFESGSSKGDIIYTRRNSFHGSSSVEKIKSADLYSSKRRFEIRNKLAASMGKEKIGGTDDAIRLQGKNGVLKVRVKHKEVISEQKPNYIHVKGNSVAPRSQELSSKNVVIHSSSYLENNMPKKRMPVDRLDKNQQRKRKPLSAGSSEESDEEAEGSDSPLKLQSNSVQVQRSTKRGRSGSNLQSPQTAQPIKLKEGKVKRGSGTEKQLLREKIRTMLINAGWTIDYRPRRGRDYFDAVYVNPTGTAYWSIIKAYDALQKQLEEEGNTLKASKDCSSFDPISDDVLSKLTRQTRKKIEKELKRKKREEAGGKRKKEFASDCFDEDESDTDSGGSGRHDDKLSSFMKRSGKSLKGTSKESCRIGSDSNSKLQERGEKSSSMSKRFIHARKSRKIGRCMLLVRNSGKSFDSETDGFVPYTGKRNLLSWLIDCGTVKLSEKVHYMNRKCTRVMLEGWITREGIHCGCCSKILPVAKFELHAASKLRQPYQNIYLSSGASLMQCQIDAWNRQEESLRNGYNKIDVNGDDPNDDTCAVCADGGNLICCDSCPSTFHQSCLGIEMLPPGDWHCPHCSCKFCGLADMSVIEGNDKKQGLVLTCCLCEGKYHCSCVEEIDDNMINSNSPPFCGKTCQELSERLQKLLGVKHELEAGLFWSLIHRTDLGSDSSVRGFPLRVEWNSKLAVALNVMDECFLPINDRRSGINMIHSVLYNTGSNICRLNYSGFYTAILEKGDEIVSAASIRIHGTEFAEMPFIGTRHIYRRQGMCRRLFSGIELALRSLKVEKLIIPAISELMDTWTTVFGFCTLKETDKQEMKVGNMLVFPGTDVLQKKLFVEDSVKKGSAGSGSFENDLNASIMPGLTTKCEFDSSPGPSSVAAQQENEEMQDKSVIDFGSEDIVHTAELGDSDCHEEVPSLPTENEEMKDKSISDLGSEDRVHTAEFDASDCREEFPSLLTENEEMVDKSVSDFTSGDMICKDETSLRSAASDCFKEIEHCLATENEEMKIISSDSGSEAVVCKDNHEVVKTPLPTVYEKMKDKSVSDFCSEQMICADENSLPNVSVDFYKVKPALPTTSPHDFHDNKSTDSEEMKCKSVSSSQQTISADERSLPNNAFADCCEEVEPYLPTASLHDCNDNKSTKSEEMKDKSVISADADCLEEVMPLATASPRDFFHNKLCSQALIKEAKLLDSNGGYMRITSSELQSDVKFDESGVDVRDRISEDACTGTCETGNVLDKSDAKCKVEVSFDDEIIQGANLVIAESGSPPRDNKMIDNSSNGVLDCLQMGGTDTQSHGDFSSINESKDDSLPNPSRVDVEIEKPVIYHSPEVKVGDDSHIVSSETDGCSASQFLHISDYINIVSAHELNMDVSRNDTVCSPVSCPAIEAMPVVDVTCKSLQHPSDSIVAVENPRHKLPSFEGEVNHVEVANDQPDSNFSPAKSAIRIILNTDNSEISPINDGDFGPISELNDQGAV